MSRWTEYRIHYGEDGESYDVLIYEGKDWRKWKRIRRGRYIPMH